MKVCPTNGLQPVTMESGLAGIWTPQLVPEIGYCEYNCNLCGTVCPTGAIRHLPIEKKKKMRLGLARVQRNICIAWAEKKQCIVCEEHCPVPNKAIALEKEIVNGKTIYKPEVEDERCIGCGICQNKCPVRPFRAIRVYPLS
jgi:Pyruvate/2-oxoacid:ferredoxin oxidoreductase delta subunit